MGVGFPLARKGRRWRPFPAYGGRLAGACRYRWGMPERPTITGFQYREEPLASELDLANWFGEPVWVPAQWPVDVTSPAYLLMLHPTGQDAHDLRSHYQLRSITDDRLLVVSGHRRRPGHLESGLVPLDGEQFVTMTRGADQPPHIVVRAPVWDVHVIGSVTPDTALFVARSLRQVSATGL